MLKIHVFNVVYITKFEQFYFKRKIIYLAYSDIKVTYMKHEHTIVT